MTPTEISIALRYATKGQREAVEAILRQVRPPEAPTPLVQSLYQEAGKILGTTVGFTTRHPDQIAARCFLVEAFRRNGYTSNQTAKMLDIYPQRINFYRRRLDLWHECPNAYARELAQLETFLDIATQKYEL